jgi:hypothetical protein
MDNQQVLSEAQLFVYELANLAKENWFKPGEAWVITLATETERTALEKNYRPTLSISGETELLRHVFEILKHSIKPADPSAQPARDRRGHAIPLTCLLAYNPGRLRS